MARPLSPSVHVSDHGILEVLRSSGTEKEETLCLDHTTNQKCLIVIDQITKFREKKDALHRVCHASHHGCQHTKPCMYAVQKHKKYLWRRETVCNYKKKLSLSMAKWPAACDTLWMPQLFCNPSAYVVIMSETSRRSAPSSRFGSSTAVAITSRTSRRCHHACCYRNWTCRPIASKKYRQTSSDWWCSRRFPSKTTKSRTHHSWITWRNFPPCTWCQYAGILSWKIMRLGSSCSSSLCVLQWLMVRRYRGLRERLLRMRTRLGECRD
jgi:hypothetical protein